MNLTAGHISRASLLSVALLVLTAVACKIDYTAGFLDEKLEEEVPDLIMYNVRETDIQEKGPKITLTADRAEDYRSLQETRFYNVNFLETNQAGESVREGHTDFGRLKDTQDADLKGNIRIDSRENGAKVEADELSWISEKKILSGPAEGRVYVLRDDGSSIDGTGFHADFRNDTIEFKGPVEGTLVSETVEQEQAAP
jgi:LPS export ABC transporter protein LptC